MQCPKVAILFGCRSGKFGPQKDGDSGKFRGKCGMNQIYVENCVTSVNHGFGGGVMTVTNAKSSAAENEKFTMKIRAESGI